jgi:nucleoid-associated protein YgaU
MKKTILTVFLLTTLFSVFAASYTNNEFQKLANEYNKKAEVAFDNGEYDLAVEYSMLAAQNSELSEAYVNTMIAKADASKQIKYAQNQLAWAEKVHGDIYYPMTYTAGKAALDAALLAFEKEDYAGATVFAKESLKYLAEIKEVTPLPQYYVVKPWAETKDCYWNISGRPYVYNNPTLWENLYQANKDQMKDPSDPDLIYPGMKMEIPSITGEYREGVYDSKKSYDAYDANK